MDNLKFHGEIVSGELNMKATKMVCVPAKEHYNCVDICLKADNEKGMNIVITTIDCSFLSFEEKKKLGYEIEKRWNNYKRS